MRRIAGDETHAEVREIIQSESRVSCREECPYECRMPCGAYRELAVSQQPSHIRVMYRLYHGIRVGVRFSGWEATLRLRAPARLDTRPTGGAAPPPAPSPRRARPSGAGAAGLQEARCKNATYGHPTGRAAARTPARTGGRPLRPTTTRPGAAPSPPRARRTRAHRRPGFRRTSFASEVDVRITLGTS